MFMECDKMSWKIIFPFILGVIAVCNAARLPSEGIVEGEVADDHQFPYQVALITEKKTICGGGIIDDQFVLTAAHCVIKSDGSFVDEPLFIAAGVNDLKKRKTEGIIVPVEKMYILIDYDPERLDSSADIAVLKLSKKLDLDNPKLKKLELPKKPRDAFIGEKATIAGWGWNVVKIVNVPGTVKHKEEGHSTDFKLKYLDTKVLDSFDCQKIYGPRRNIRESHLCAKAEQLHKKPSGVCSGDSGSPLVLNDETVIGIVSTSPLGCNESGLPAIYTRVSRYLNFIENAKNDVVTDYMIVSDS